MNKIDFLSQDLSIEDLLSKPTLLFDNNKGHKIYWIGIPDDTAFRCNSYLVVDNDEAIIIDPGSREFFGFVKERIANIIPLSQVKAMVLCHQDPDVAASMYDWLLFDPKIKVISSDRTNVLLPHFGIGEYDFYSIGSDHDFSYRFTSGKKLEFIEAPFLHFPGAFTTYDRESAFLLSGDIWAALDIDWKLVVSDFDDHQMKLDLFHLDYMASNVAAKGFIYKLDGYKIDAILPQHGSIIPQKYVSQALKYLEELKCGLDIVYPELTK